MEQFILGVFLIGISVVIGWLARRAHAARQAAIGAPVSVKQAAQRVSEGNAAVLTVCAPVYAQRRLRTAFGEKTDAAYYEAQVLSISGKAAAPFYTKAPHEREVYLQDAGGGEKLWVDVAAFGERAELLPDFRETARPGSPLFSKVEAKAPQRLSKAPDAYRVLEGYLPSGGAVTLRARIVRRSGRLFAQPDAKGSFLTYRRK